MTLATFQPPVLLPNQPPGTLTLEMVRQYATQALTSTQRCARDMYGGDHLGSLTTRGQYAYWRGPMLSLDERLRGAEAQAAAREVREFQNVLQRSFTSVNLVREITDREVSASAARMTWETQSDQDTLLQLWWRSGGHHAERAIRQALTTARLEGRAVLRFRIGELPAIRTPEMLAQSIRLEVVPPEQARVIEHPDTLQHAALYAYQWQGQDAAELCSLDDRGLTVMRVMRGSVTQASTPLDLGGRLTLIELNMPVLITEQVLQNQMAYNTVITMSVRNTELAGFVERFGVNLEPPYMLEPDPDQPGQQRRRYLPVNTGAARLNLWRQATSDKVDAAGKYVGEEALGRAAQYGRLEPTSAAPLTAAAQLLKENIYGETGQTFVLMAADASSSGRSREVAMSDFDSRREVTTDAARYLIGDVAETALALIYALSGQPRPGVKVVGMVRGQAIRQAADERAADLADLAAGIMTPEEIRARRGLDEAVVTKPETPPPE